MLTRSSQIGEFYVMSPPQVNPGEKGMMHCCDILIFDEEGDRHVRVTWAEALAATCITADGKVGGTGSGAAGDGAIPFVHKTDKMGDNATLKDWYDAAKAWADATTDSATLKKLFGGGDGGGAAAGGEDGEAAAGGGGGGGGATGYNSLDKDIRIIVARPFIEHLMHNVIMTVSGRDTGATLFGPADMQLSANTQVKTIEGHCEFGGRSNPTTLLACTCALTASPCLNRHWTFQGRDHEAAERAREFSGRSNPSPLPAHSY